MTGVALTKLIQTDIRMILRAVDYKQDGSIDFDEIYAFLKI